MSQYPQKQSKMRKLAALFDDLPESQQKQLGYAGIAYAALITLFMAMGVLEGALGFVAFLSLPGAALLTWAAFKKEPVAHSIQSAFGSSRSSMSTQGGGQGTFSEDEATDPLAARSQRLPDVPTQIKERRANEVRKVLTSADRPLTVADIATRLRWSDEAIISGLDWLYEQGELQEKFPDDHAMQWQYQLAPSSVDDEFDELMRAHTQQAGASTDDDKDRVPAQNEYVMEEDVETPGSR